MWSADTAANRTRSRTKLGSRSRWPSIIALALSAVLGGVAGTRAEDPHSLHRLAGGICLDVLPADIAPFFRRESSRFLDHIVEPATQWPQDRQLRRRNDWHRCPVDLEAVDQSPRDRLRAFLAFPRDHTEAVRLYRRQGRSQRGSLPWAVEECFNDLVTAFRDADAATVLQKAGHLAHFAADVADPFRLTANDDGSDTNNLVIGFVRGIHADDVMHCPHERHTVGLLNRFGEHYADDVSVSTADYRPIREPLAAAFAAMQESLADLDELLAADRDTCAVLEIVDRPTFESAAGDYFAAVDSRCGPIWTKHIQLGAVFAANLIGGAWQAAGQPTIESIESRKLAVEGQHESTQAASSGAFIGSRHSNIYHRVDCQFARQIADDNLVRFKSAAEAQRDNRRGCKACNP